MDGYIIHYSDELSHHGIKGQQWGVRNGPPYPLDSSVSTGKRLKTQKNDEGSAALAYIALMYTLPFAPAIAKAAKNKIVKSNYNKFMKDYEDIDVATRIKTQKDLPKIKGEHTIEDDMAMVNAKGRSSVEGRNQNCVLCSVAYNMRRDGYDVVAGDRRDGLYAEQTKAMFKNSFEYNRIPKLNRGSTAQTRAYMATQTKPGEHGLFSCPTKFGGGHCIAWENVGGKIVFIDGQVNKIYSNRDMDRLFNYKVATDESSNISWYPKFVTTTASSYNVKELADHNYIKVKKGD